MYSTPDSLQGAAGAGATPLPVERGVDERAVDGRSVDEETVDERTIGQRAVAERPVAERPVDERPVDERPVDERPVDERPVDERTMRAWREWLGALTTDAEAAMATALAYDQLDAQARDSWIEALAADADEAEVPRFAAYAPLLAVELNDARRQRIRHAIGEQQPELTPVREPCSFAGYLPKNVRLVVIVRPLYLEFVQVVACAFRTGIGFDWVKHDPIIRAASAPKAGERLAGADLEKIPLKAVIDELAHAVLAHQRHYVALPDALSTLADLFVPVVEG